MDVISSSCVFNLDTRMEYRIGMKKQEASWRGITDGLVNIGNGTLKSRDVCMPNAG